MSLRIGFIGYGEVGQVFSRQLAAKSDVHVSTYDVLFDGATKESGLRELAAMTGVAALGSTSAVCKAAEIIISAVTADSAVIAAEQAAKHLTDQHVYIDL